MNSTDVLAGFAGAAARSSEVIALHWPAGRRTYSEISYGELAELCDDYTRRLWRAGLRLGMRACLLLPPGPDLTALAFALVRLGVVPVLIDPGIPKPALRTCLAEAAPEAFIGVPLAHAARVLLGWGRRSVRIPITVGRRWFWRGPTLRSLRDAPPVPELPAPDPERLAAIAFTSGSTGVPKGVELRARHLAAQSRLAGAILAREPGEVLMSTFPPFALIGPANGLSMVVPDMNPIRPADADPVKLVAEIDRFGVTGLFGSPALLDTLSRHCVQYGIVLPLRTVIAAGVALDPRIAERLRNCLPAEAVLHSAYGATECLPVSVIDSSALLGDARMASERGAGSCVGAPLPENLVRVIRVDDGPIERWSDDLLMPNGVVGEITVSGPSASDAYFGRPEATALAKIVDGDRIVHRIGDLGWMDDEGVLWFCGRKSQRVRAATGDIYTEQVEPIANIVRGVRRSALVGIGEAGQQRPVLCVEAERGVGRDERVRIASDVLDLFAEHEHTAGIADVLFHPKFPVDIRHNAKIRREVLASWVARKLR